MSAAFGLVTLKFSNGTATQDRASHRNAQLAFRREALGIADVYLKLRAALDAFDTVALARMTARRRIVEERIEILDRALYHLDARCDFSTRAGTIQEGQT